MFAHWQGFDLPIFSQHDVFRGFDSLFNAVRTASPRPSGGPVTRIYETDDSVVVEADLPGWTQEAIKVEVLENTLTIEGEAQTSSEDEGTSPLRTERNKASFSRSWKFRSALNPDVVGATLRHGVLTVTLAKTERAGARSIPIEIQ